MGTRRILKTVLIGMVSVLVIIVLLVGGLFLFSTSLAGDAPAPLQLSAFDSAQQADGTASPEGTWVVQNGSVAGFRVGVGQSSTIVGRTSDVTGSLSLSPNEISSGSFQIDLSRVTLGGKRNASFFQLLETSQYPSITVTLNQPVMLKTNPSDGQTITSQVPAVLSIHGITKTVTLMVNARFNGSLLEAVGSAPVRGSDWNVKSPFGVHNDALIEFFVVLKRH